jgi:GntR family transcriptional regulator
MESKNEKALYLQVKEYLLDKIKLMNPTKNQLEPENLLASKLNVSRQTIRQAMSDLMREGIISRWHGKGNYGHPNVLDLSMRIDLKSDFILFLREGGYSVKMIFSESKKADSSWAMQKRIPEARDKKVVTFEKYYYTDNELAIHCRYEFFEEYLKIPIEAGNTEGDFNDFLRKYCKFNSTYTLAWIRAGQNNDIAQKFVIDQGTSFSIWDEVFFNHLDQKLFFVEVYFNPKIMDLSFNCTF